MQSYFFANVAPGLDRGAGPVASTFFHLSPEGRGRVSEASEGEGVRKLKFFSCVRTPSPQPSPLWGEGVRMRKPTVTQERKSHG
jgi:hypothetical protein